MKQGRTPDRVHVVRPPEDSHAESVPTPAAREVRSTEIVRTLAQISDKLKRSEAERYELLAELREYRKALIELEDKAEKTEKAYLTLDNQIKQRDAAEQESAQRHARFERALKEAESKLVQASASQNLLDQRIKGAEDVQTGLIQRMDESVSQQARLDRQFDKITQDRARVLRKVERMEEILTETQDTLRARALVLLTDQSAAAQAVSLPRIAAIGDGMGAEDLIQDSKAPWWRKSVKVQGVGMISMVVAALLFGWTVNQLQQPEIPKIAVLENGGLAKLNLKENRWEPLATAPSAIEPAGGEKADGKEQEEGGLPLAPTTVSASPQKQSETEAPAPEQTPAAKTVLNASDEELMKALERDPDQLAAQLNEIAPSSDEKTGLEEGKTDAQVPASSVPTSEKTGGYDPLSVVRDQAFTQDPALTKAIAAEKSNAPLNKRAQPDPALPDPVKTLEKQAISGSAEAQHDLAAIYTAGRGGVAQNFEKAAFWFREAANQNLPNAAYNLGVLYHQGLGVERDLPRALYWYREAAKLGHPEAQYNLGIAYIEGIGADYNPSIAAAFFESAANQGVVEAAYNLGLIYENGLLGDKARNDEALLWYKIAADGGNADAKAALEQLASSMQINMDEVEKVVERLQSAYVSAHGRSAGKAGDAAAQTSRNSSSGPKG